MGEWKTCDEGPCKHDDKDEVRKSREEMAQVGQGHGKCEREPKQEPRQEKQKQGPTRRGVSKEGAGEVGARYRTQKGKNTDVETKSWGSP
jgi:hypothetical protein